MADRHERWGKRVTKYPAAKPTQVRIQEKPFGGLVPGEVVVIPSPDDVERALLGIPAGETISQPELRSRLATQHEADNACPAMTGWQLRFVAEVAVEALDAGAAPDEVAPFWRVVEPGSKIAGRLPNGSALITDLRQQEQRDVG